MKLKNLEKKSGADGEHFQTGVITDTIILDSQVYPPRLEWPSFDNNYKHL